MSMKVRNKPLTSVTNGLQRLGSVDYKIVRKTLNHLRNSDSICYKK